MPLCSGTPDCSNTGLAQSACAYSSVMNLNLAKAERAACTHDEHWSGHLKDDLYKGFVTKDVRGTRLHAIASWAMLTTMIIELGDAISFREFESQYSVYSPLNIQDGALEQH